MALQAQLHMELPPSSSDLSGPGSGGPSSLPYSLSSGSNAYDRSPPHHFNSRASSSQLHRNKSHDLLSFPFGAHHHNSWSTPTSQPGEGQLCDATTATTLSSISGGTLASDAGPSGSFNRSSAQPSGLLGMRSGSYPSTSVGHSMHVTTTPMASITASAQDSYHHGYGNSGYGPMDFTTTPNADSEASQAPSTTKTAPLPPSFSPPSLLHPATNCPMPTQVAVSALGQSQSSALAPGIATGTGSASESSTRTSIASTSSTANTPLTPITPLTPVSTTALYSNSISAPSNDVSGGLLPVRGSNSLPTLSNDVDIHENFMGLHPDIKARMHSVSLPAPSLAVNGNAAQGMSLHSVPASMPALGHPGSAMTAGPTSAPLPTRHFSLPSLPQDYRTSQSYSTQPNSMTASIHAGPDDHAKRAALMRGHAGSTEASQPGATLGFSLGANSSGLDHNISHETADLASLGQRPLPSGPPSHHHLAFGMSPYTAGRSMMDHGIGLGMNMNLGLGSSAFNPGTSTTSAAAAAAAAMAMGTGHPGNAGRAATSTTSSGTSKKHKCKVCDKRFTRPSSLQTHMYSHTGEKPFTCDFDSCGRQFSVVSNLRRHKKVHKGVTPPSQASGGTSPSVSR